MKRSGMLLALGLGLLSVASASTLWQHATPGYRWSFPRDHWVHDSYKNEWWYLTGHLYTHDHPPRRFGYQFTLFHLGVTRTPAGQGSEWASHAVVMGNAAVSDAVGGIHYFSDVVRRDTPLLAGFGRFPDRRLAWTTGPAGSAKPWSIDWNGKAFDLAASDDAQHFSYALSTVPEKPLIFEGPGGYSRKTGDGREGSNYYSFTRLYTTGTVTLGTTTFRVEGESWMDKEFGSERLGEKQVGWDWFSLQLDDKSEVMIYILRDAHGAVDFLSGTWVSRKGEPRYLSAKDVTVQPSDHWTSPISGVRYPSRWTVKVNGNTYEITPLMSDQENRGHDTDITYWEGAVDISADHQTVGKGYVELTGYH